MKEEWIENCIRGDRNAQEQFYRHYAPKVMGICRRYASDKENAKDVMQEAFVSIFLSMKTQKDIQNMDAWVARVTVNTAINYFKKHKKHFYGLSTEEVSVANRDHDHILNDLGMQEMMALIDGLPLGYKMVFSMYVIEGFNHREIADKLGISEGTSKSQLSRAKQLLRNQLKSKAHSSYEKSII